MIWAEWPLWLVGPVLFLLLCLALEIGFRLSARRPNAKEKSGSDFLVSATLGLLALLLGFSFSLSLQRHEERRSLVIAEANALGTSWLRIQAVDAPDRETVAAPFRKYAQTRLNWSQASDESVISQRLADQGAKQQAQIWAAAIAALANGEEVVDGKTLLDPINESFDLAAEREAQRQAHLPGAMLVMLIIFMLFSTTLVGWRLGEVGHRMVLPSGLTVLLLTLAVVMTMDLDMSRSGLITVSQEPMQQLVKSIATRPNP